MSYGPYGQSVPPPRPPKQGMSTGAKVGIGCGGCLGASLLLFLFAGCVAVIGADTPEEPSPPPAASSEEEVDEAAAEVEPEAHPGLGEAVEHGNWEITVVALHRDVPTAELDSVLAEEPSGQWVTVEITATNTTSGPQFFDGSSQVLMDADGSMYSSDALASDGLGLFEEANPGSTVSGRLAYDVPTDLEIDHMLVNGETFLDDGVRVDLD